MTGGYRKTPILQVGAEFYCDTLNILQTVEKLGDSGALYPKGRKLLQRLSVGGLRRALSSMPCALRSETCPESLKN
jgi:hypothetical protein